MRERVGLKSPVRENCTPGSVRGASGNRRPYRDGRLFKLTKFFTLAMICGVSYEPERHSSPY